MNAATQLRLLAGPAGRIDVAFDPPQGVCQGVAVIAHPHPLFGGTRDNKVAQTLARALLAVGYACWRPNFRGVGASEGVHDEGLGETDDLMTVIAAAQADPSVPPDAPVLLAGFSFGGFVQSRVAQRLASEGHPPKGLVLIAPAVSRFDVLQPQVRTLLVHGELDDVVPLASAFDWARPQELPIVVIPGADHFFHRRLPLLKTLVTEWVRGEA